MQYDTDRLKQVRQTVQVLTEQVETLNSEQCKPDRAGANPADRLSTAKAWKCANELINVTFEKSHFSNPAWNILLDLYIRQHERRAVSITSACIAADVPPTTALRYVDYLVGREWVERIEHTDDKRVRHLKLTQSGLDRVNSALDGVNASNERLGIGHLRLVKQIDGELQMAECAVNAPTTPFILDRQRIEIGKGLPQPGGGIDEFQISFRMHQASQRPAAFPGVPLP